MQSTSDFPELADHELPSTPADTKPSPSTPADTKPSPSTGPTGAAPQATHETAFKRFLPAVLQYGDGSLDHMSQLLITSLYTRMIQSWSSHDQAPFEIFVTRLGLLTFKKLYSIIPSNNTRGWTTVHQVVPTDANGRAALSESANALIDAVMNGLQRINKNLTYCEYNFWLMQVIARLAEVERDDRSLKRSSKGAKCHQYFAWEREREPERKSEREPEREPDPEEPSFSLPIGFLTGLCGLHVEKSTKSEVPTEKVVPGQEKSKQAK